MTQAQSGPAPPSRIKIRKLRAKAELIELLDPIELFGGLHKGACARRKSRRNFPPTATLLIATRTVF
jgi:hypothetical protein